MDSSKGEYVNTHGAADNGVLVGMPAHVPDARIVAGQFGDHSTRQHIINCNKIITLLFCEKEIGIRQLYDTTVPLLPLLPVAAEDKLVDVNVEVHVNASSTKKTLV